MAITLLAACQQIMGESGFDVPVAIVGTNDQLMYLANAAIRTLRVHQWQKLRATSSITLTSAVTYTLATDFWSLIPDTLWPRSSGRPATMPVTTSFWAQLKAQIGISSLAFNCRFMDGELNVQNPVAGYVLDYEYVSKNAVQATGGGAKKEAFTLETDVCLLDDEMFCRELKWRFKKEKGIDDWQVDYEDAQAYLLYRKGVDAGAQVITPNTATVFPEPYTDLWKQ